MVAMLEEEALRALRRLLGVGWLLWEMLLLLWKVLLWEMLLLLWAL